MSTTSIGATLSGAREDAGLSLEDVAAATRIRRTVLAGIEQDDFRACGGDFYARGHLRTVATRLGLDPAPLLAEFDSARPGAESPRASTVFESETAARPDRREPNWKAAMIAAVVLIVGYALVHTVSPWSGGDGQSARRGALPSGSPSAITSALPSASPSPTAPSTPTAAGGARNRVTVALRATRRSWVQVTTGTGRPVFSGMLAAGTTRAFSDRRRLRLVIGDAGAVSVTVNGRRLGRRGRSGEVARVQFTPTDPGAARLTQ